ncbi:MAG: class IV adenylate cyclase [Pyrinomonadaceae bacterium]
MAIEIEKKYRLDKRRHDQLVAKLAEGGAKFTKEVFEENYLHRGGLLDERGAVLRLRKIGDYTILTYKEKLKNDDDIKHKVEYETVVADVDAMENIIGRLGYRLSVIYEKRRKIWHFKNVEVMIDELPFGLYMEIEGTAENISKSEKLLGIQDLETETRGYPRLTAKYGKINGDVAESRFERTVAV